MAPRCTSLGSCLFPRPSSLDPFSSSRRGHGTPMHIAWFLSFPRPSPLFLLLAVGMAPRSTSLGSCLSLVPRPFFFFSPWESFLALLLQQSGSKSVMMLGNLSMLSVGGCARFAAPLKTRPL